MGLAVDCKCRAFDSGALYQYAFPEAGGESAAGRAETVPDGAPAGFTGNDSH